MVKVGLFAKVTFELRFEVGKAEKPYRDWADQVYLKDWKEARVARLGHEERKSRDKTGSGDWITQDLAKIEDAN